MNGLNTHQSAAYGMRSSQHYIPCQSRSQMEELNEILNLSEKNNNNNNNNALMLQHMEQHQLIESS